MSIQAILFDLDGTLIDQFEAIHRAFSRTISGMGIPPPSYEKVKRSIGGASEETMIKLIGAEHAKEAVRRLRPIFEEEMLNGVLTLPFVHEGLKALCNNGICCGVLTNKYGPHARATCEYLGLSQFLKFTLGTSDTQWKKPASQLTKIALDKLGYGTNQTTYVGDSPYDFKTAENVAMTCHLVATGTHTKEELEALQATSCHQNFKSVVSTLLSLS